MKNWTVTQDGFDPSKAGYWASIFTISNGFFGTRGVDEETRAGEPSTYVAGTFTEDFIGVDILPNTPNWLVIELEADGERFELEEGNVEEIDEALITCPKCTRWYPVIEGIACMLPDDLRMTGKQHIEEVKFLERWKERIDSAILENGTPFGLSE